MLASAVRFMCICVSCSQKKLEKAQSRTLPKIESLKKKIRVSQSRGGGLLVLRGCGVRQGRACACVPCPSGRVSSIALLCVCHWLMSLVGHSHDALLLTPLQSRKDARSIERGNEAVESHEQYLYEKEAKLR